MPLNKRGLYLPSNLKQIPPILQLLQLALELSILLYINSILIKKTPAESGLTFVNGKFVAIVGQPSFVSRKIIIASPLQEMATGTTVNYQFANNLIYTNATTAIKNLTVYFNDAIPVSIISNGVLVLTTKTINYTLSGNKVLKFVATFTDNSSITTVGYHYFAYQPQPIDARLAASIACDGPNVERGMYKSIHGFQGYDETVAYLGKFDYTVFITPKIQMAHPILRNAN